jgi:tRNA threonylcarbamoyl adenosine modification protein YeaZ
LLVVASGPGSFTGLRVGLSTVKALSETCGAPIVAISVLEAIAFASKARGIVLSALDAQRQEVFVGEYQVDGESIPKQLHEALASAVDFTTWLSARIAVPVTYTPDAVVHKAVREAGSPAELISRPGADVYARLGLQKFLEGQTTPAETLDANYIRRSDAEIFSAPKLGIKQK